MKINRPTFDIFGGLNGTTRADVFYWFMETNNFLFNAKVMLAGHDPIRRYTECPVDIIYQLRNTLKKIDINTDIQPVMDLIQDIQGPDWMKTVTPEYIEHTQGILHTAFKAFQEKYPPEPSDTWD